MTDITTPDISGQEFFSALRKIQVETRCPANAYQQWDVIVPIHLAGEDLNRYLARHLPGAESDAGWSYTGEYSDDRAEERMLSIVDGEALDIEYADTLYAATRPHQADPPAPMTYTVLLVLPDYLHERSDDEKHFAVRTRTDSPEAAITSAAGYLLWHFDTDYPDRAAAQEHADDIECIGVAKGEITFDADRPITLTAG